MPFKKSKSNDALSVIGSIRTGRINGLNSTALPASQNQHVAYKQLRWVLRVVQIFCAVFVFSFASSTDGLLVGAMKVNGLWLVMEIMEFVFIGLSLFLAAIYLARYFGEWSTVKVMRIETASDAVVSLWHWVLFGVYVKMAGDDCPPGVTRACDMFNWATSFVFFSAVAWTVALATDCYAWYRHGEEMSGRSRLSDENTEMEIRRQRMQK